MPLTKRHYEEHKTVITGQNLNDIQDAIIALEQAAGIFPGEGGIGGEQATEIKMARSGQTVTITVTLQSGRIVEDTITLDDNDYPVAGVFNGVACGISWEGF